MFYDDDMVVHPDIVERLLSRKKDVIMGLCYIRGYPFEPMMFRFNKDGNLIRYPLKEEDVEDGLIKVDAVGCAVTLINCEVFKKIPSPWFVTGKTHTEDIYFCMKGREYLENFEVYVDTTVESGHMLDKPVLNSFSKKLLKDIQEQGANQIWQPSSFYSKGKAPEEVSPNILFDKEIENGKDT